MESRELPPTRASQQSKRTLRLTFSYEGSAVRLVSRQSVEMITPPANAVSIKEGQTGFWYELHDQEGHLLYQRAVQNPIRFDVEVFSDDPQQSISRQKVDNPRGTFVLFVPDIPQGYSVVLFSSPLNPEEATQPAKELVRYIVAQEPKGEGQA
jgi:hypothetical protein